MHRRISDKPNPDTLALSPTENSTLATGALGQQIIAQTWGQIVTPRQLRTLFVHH